jgi:hypothetical protein
MPRKDVSCVVGMTTVEASSSLPVYCYISLESPLAYVITPRAPVDREANHVVKVKLSLCLTN